MTSLLTQIFKYLILFIAVLYTIINFLALRQGSAARTRRLFRAQNLFTLLLMFCCYFVIFMKTEDWTVLAFMGIQLAFFLAYMALFLHLYPDASRVILSNTVFLFAVGLMFLTRLDYDRAGHQFLIGICAMLVMLAVPVVIRHLRVLSKWAYLYAVAGIGLLAVVWRIGSTTFGAQLTLSLGPVQLQPSEFVKISFVFFTASMFRQKQSFGRVVLTTVLAAAHVLVLVASTDLGSAFVYFMAYLFMLFVATHNPAFFAAGLGAGAAASVGAYYLFDHVRVRVQMWKDPFSDYDNKGYQLSQSLMALSSGGLFGLGLCGGYPNTIPLARNDFIFSAICEELGLIFGALLILIYLGFIIQLFWISIRIKGRFYQLLGTGFAAMVGVQVFMHIGGATALIPSTGITLPLISYGGSSVLSTLIIVGIIQGLCITAAAEKRETAGKEGMPNG